MATIRRILLLFIAVCFINILHVQAGFYPMTKVDGMKCTPGHTEIYFTGRQDPLRTHTSSKGGGEDCKMCVCSVNGMDRHCWKRPASNINECIFLSRIKSRGVMAATDDLESKYDHFLANRIRRDFIYHKDELPYDPTMRCRRGLSYYTNKENGTVDTIDFQSETLLDYPNKTICWYCLCEATGFEPECLPKHPSICQYYRELRGSLKPAERYAHVYHRDVPTFFRDIAWRVRRGMDESNDDDLDYAGYDGVPSACIPFVSHYSDCDENIYKRCVTCSCNAQGAWQCRQQIGGLRAERPGGLRVGGLLDLGRGELLD